jgi:hypothetical protein
MAALPGLLCAQTLIDLGAQSRNVDFSAAVATRPFKSGGVVPSICSTGETFFKIDAPAGQNLYTCTASNTWTQMVVTSGNSGAGGVEVIKGQAGQQVIGRQLLSGEGNILTQQTDTVTVETDTAVTPRYASAATAPTGVCQTGRDQFTRVSGFPHFYGCVGGVWKPIYGVSSTSPTTCAVGEIYFNSSDSGLYVCTTADQWARVNKSGLDLSVAGECFVTYSCVHTGAAARQPLPAEAVAGKMTAVLGTSTSAFAAAVYADNAGVPGAKIGADLRYVDLAAGQYRTALWGDGTLILPPGVYWIGFSSEDPVTQYIVGGSSVASIGGMLTRLTVNPPVVACSNPVVGTGAGYALPSTCGTTSAVPLFVDAPLLLVSAQ